MSKTKILLIIILVSAVLAWLFSGILTSDSPEIKASLATDKAVRDSKEQVTAPTSVRGIHSTATQQNKTLVLRGRIIDKDKATVTAETSGQIVATPVDIGNGVSIDDVLCEIAENDRQARLIQAQDALALAEKEYESSLSLSEHGFQQEIATARFKAARSAAYRDLVSEQIEFANTKIRAPIAGILNEVHVSVGDFIQVGNACATILALSPIFAQAFLAEEYVDQVQVGSSAEVTLPSGQVRTGHLTFLSKQADSQTQTFRLEVELPNTDYAISSGLSASIVLSTEKYEAHKIPTSVLVLDEFGNIGAKTVGTDNRVDFYDIEIVREDQDGVWVSGLPPTTTIITVGQGLVVPDERVTVQYSN